MAWEVGPHSRDAGTKGPLWAEEGAVQVEQHPSSGLQEAAPQGGLGAQVGPGGLRMDGEGPGQDGGLRNPWEMAAVQLDGAAGGLGRRATVHPQRCCVSTGDAPDPIPVLQWTLSPSIPAAITKCQELGSLSTMGLNLSHFWRLGV